MPQREFLVQNFQPVFKGFQRAAVLQHDLLIFEVLTQKPLALQVIAGKAVLVEVSYAPATPEKAMLASEHHAAAMICSASAF